jgi:endonuclease/exonuclease/phosphatase family metal-dependent hydrolase
MAARYAGRDEDAIVTERGYGRCYPMKSWQVRTLAVLVVLALSPAAFAAPVPAPFSLDADVGSALEMRDGAFSLTNPTGAAPVRGCFAPVHLTRDGDAVVLTATMSRTVDAGNVQFRMGLFDARGRAGTSAYLGYFVGNSASNNPNVVFRRNGLGATPYWSGTDSGSYLAGSAVTTPGAMPAGTYSLSLSITRVTAAALRLDYAVVRVGGGYSMVGSFDDKAPQQLAEDLAYDCAGFLLNGGGFTGAIALDAIDVARIPAAGPAPQRAALANLSVMSFNIRYSGNEPANYRWSARRPRVARVIMNAAPDVIGVQEALAGQVTQMRSDLPAYGFYGVGRDDGVRAGEHAGIFFRTSRFTVLDSGTFWLSDTPTVPGTTFSTMAGATPRIASWVMLSDASTGRSYLVLNTHWDNQDQSARDRSAALIRERVAGLASGRPVILLGDLNTTETSAAAITLIGSNVTAQNRLIDAFRRVTPNVGSQELTFQGFTNQTSGQRIDFVLHSPELQATSAQIVRDTGADGYLPSDHYPVTASFNVAIALGGASDAGVPDSDPKDAGTFDASVADAALPDGEATDIGADAPPGEAAAEPAGPETGGCSVPRSRGAGAPWGGAVLVIAVLLTRRPRASN